MCETCKCRQKVWHKAVKFVERVLAGPLQTSLLSRGVDRLSERRHCPCSGLSHSSRVNSLDQAGADDLGGHSKDI